MGASLTDQASDQHGLEWEVLNQWWRYEDLDRGSYVTFTFDDPDIASIPGGDLTAHFVGVGGNVGLDDVTADSSFFADSFGSSCAVTLTLANGRITGKILVVPKEIRLFVESQDPNCSTTDGDEYTPGECSCVYDSNVPFELDLDLAVIGGP